MFRKPTYFDLPLQLCLIFFARQSWFLIVWLFVGSLKAVESDTLNLTSVATEDSLIITEVEENKWLGQLHQDVPYDYLTQINDVVPARPPAAKSKLVGWVDYDKHQVAEDPEGLSNTGRILTEIQRTGRFFSKLDGNTLLQIPFGIKDHYGEIEYFLGFNNLRIYPDYASIDIVASLFIPALGDTLKFSGANIKYNNRSGIVGNAKLALVQDFVSEVNEGKTAIIVRGFREQAEVGTSIKVNCDGIEEIQFGMDFLFNNHFIKPVDKTLDEVQAFSQVKYRPESGFVVNDISIVPFYFKGLDNAAFAIKNLTVDLDETVTSAPYIENYFNQLNDQGNSPGINTEQWTGFYCESFQLMIGKDLITNHKGKPVVVAGNHIVIDDLGFTAAINVQNRILDLNEANVAGWPISIDEVNLDILANQLRSFGFGGLIHVPLFDKKKDRNPVPSPGQEVSSGPADPASSLTYRARYVPDSASLDFQIAKIGTQDFSIPVMFADLRIKQGSYLQLKTGESLTISAYINGSVSIKGDLGNDSGKQSLKIPEILFEGLYISNKAPYLSVKQIHPVVSDSASMGKFLFTFDAITLNDYQPAQYHGQLKQLRFEKLRMNLGAITDGDEITLSTSMNVYFAVSSEGGRQKWTGKDLEIEKFKFEGTLPGIDYVEGELGFLRNDPDYGTGFIGGGEVRFGFLDASVSMVCMFGNTGDAGYQYSYVDAALDFDKPVGGNSFQVYMLMAGYHKNMARQELTKFKTGTYAEMDNATLVPGGQFPENRFVPALNAWGIRGGLIARAGEAAIMGVRILYEKNKSEGQGFASRFLFEGLIELMPEGEITTSRATGRLVGEGEASDSDTNLTPGDFAGSGAFGGYIRIQVVRDQTGNTFDAALGIHGTVGGIQINFYGEYYKSPANWHLFVGKPDNRLELGYTIADSDIVTAALSINAYLMVGNSEYMPKQLPPPYSKGESNYSNLVIAYDSLVSNPATNIFGNQVAALSAGKAIAFGAGLGFEIKIEIPKNRDDKWLLVNAGADIGFDLLMSKNRPECNLQQVSEVGINGWYLYGQMYAGVAAKVGIKIKQKSLKIFEGGACVLIQGAGFNPTWGVGTWRFQYQVLFLKGQAQGVFQFGEPCNNLTASFDPEKILDRIYPSRLVTGVTENATSELVGINSDFRMDFVMAADRKIRQSMTDFENGSTESFNIQLISEVKVQNQNGKLIEGDILYDNHGSTLVFRPKIMLVPGDELTLHLNAVLYDDKGIYTINGESFSVDTSVTYRVDPEGILGLSSADVVISYPVINQQYFHKDEFDQMMISYGKSLPSDGNTFSSHLFRDELGHLVEIEKADVEVTVPGLVQKNFRLMENRTHYQWIIKASSPTGKSADIAAIDFQTSSFSTFAEKAKTVGIDHFSLSSLDKPDTILPLQTISEEPLEFYEGNVFTQFVAENATGEKSPLATPDGSVKIQTMLYTLSAPGRQYLTRFQSSFSIQDKYLYFKEVYEHHVPYGATLEIKCQVDDTPGAQQNADPGDAVQTYAMYSWTDQLLKAGPGNIQYNILKNLSDDYRQFRLLKPGIPPFYADCESYDKGLVPYYRPGLYPMRIRYYIPAFEKYSSTNLEFDFRLVP